MSPVVYAAGCVFVLFSLYVTTMQTHERVDSIPFLGIVFTIAIQIDLPFYMQSMFSFANCIIMRVLYIMYMFKLVKRYMTIWIAIIFAYLCSVQSIIQEWCVKFSLNISYFRIRNGIGQKFCNSPPVYNVHTKYMAYFDPSIIQAYQNLAVFVTFTYWNIYLCNDMNFKFPACSLQGDHE